MKKIQDVREIIDALSLTKDADSVAIPIGMTGDQCHKLVFSCRGRVGNNSGYAVYGNWPEEIRNFLTGLLCNACRRYSPAELALSFYDCRREADGDYDYVRELPNADRVLRIETAEQLLEETERLREKYDARLSEIGKYGNCYARAVSAAAKQGTFFSMPQELLTFVVPEEVFTEWQSSFSVRNWLDFLMSKLWRVGIYPVVVVCGAWCDFTFRRSFGSEVILFSSRNGFKEASALKPFGALVSIGWDCWDWSDGGREAIDVPEYNDAWVEDTMEKPTKDMLINENFVLQYYLYKNKIPFACDKSGFFTFKFVEGEWVVTERIMSVLLYEDEENDFQQITRKEAVKFTDGVDATEVMQRVIDILYDDV